MSSLPLNMFNYFVYNFDVDSNVKNVYRQAK